MPEQESHCCAKYIHGETIYPTNSIVSETFGAIDHHLFRENYVMISYIRNNLSQDPRKIRFSLRSKLMRMWPFSIQ